MGRKPYSVKIKTSNRRGKKMMDTFFDKNGDKIKTTHFGASGYSDFTKHKDANRKKRYITRHQKREYWNKPMTAGALSRWVLWNKPALKTSIADYKKKFKLK